MLCRAWTRMKVFPACAGVIQTEAGIWKKATGFPRMRGGDPQRRLVEDVLAKFSPHARG